MVVPWTQTMMVLSSSLVEDEMDVSDLEDLDLRILVVCSQCEDVDVEERRLLWNRSC